MTMGSDIRYLQQLDFPAYAVQLDWLLTDRNLIADGYDLQSAVIVALGTDALAPPDEDLPDPDATDRRGWWGDMDAQELWGGWPVGCLLWLLQRAKITGVDARQGATVARAEGWTRAAMQPFIDNLIASRVDVQADRTDVQRIDVGVTIYRGPEVAIDLRYQALWDDLLHPPAVTGPPAGGAPSPPPESKEFTLDASILGGPDVLG
jgi:phage gp46-like protein